MKRLLDALGRLGGAVFAPRRTLVGVLERGDGSVFEVLALALLVAVAVTPTGIASAILVLRVNVLDGLMAISNAVIGRFGNAFILALVGAAIVFAAGRFRVPLDRAIDAASYAIVPHLALAAVGATFAELGVELWAMPHRTLKGDGWFFVARLLVGYLWPALLIAGLARAALRGPSATAAPADPAPAP